MWRLFFGFAVLALVASCTYTLKVKDGKTAFDRKQYAVATKMLQKEIAKGKTKSEKKKKSYLLAESFTQLHKPEQAQTWYKFAYDNGYGTDALKGYAFSLKMMGNYEEAKAVFKQLGQEIGSPYEFRKEISSCTVADLWNKDSAYNEFRIINQPFNTSSAEYAPYLVGAHHLIFTSDRGAVDKKTKYNWTGNSFSDIYETDENGNCRKIENPFNSSGNDGTLCYNQNQTEAYFTSCNDIGNNDVYCKLMISRKIGNNWTESEPLPFCENKVNYGHPTLSSDGNTLYFCCNKSDGWGGYDIYKVERKNGIWGIPDLLGRSINSSDNELFPNMDGDTLYFASNGHSGMGGLDIYKSYKSNKDTWTPAQNLKAPINSCGDDFSFIPDRFTQLDTSIKMSGYFTSNRVGGKGNDDIYKFEKVTPKPRPEKKDTIKKNIEYRLVLEGYVLEKIFENPLDPNSKVKARKPLANADVNVSFGNNKAKSFKTGEDGFFTFDMDENTEYLLYAFKDNYLRKDGRFSTVGIAKDPANPIQKYEVELVLDQIFKNKEIVLDNIYYDFDKSDIREDAKPTLNQLANTLKQNPSIKIQLSSHTDCRGNEGYNEELSQRRAQSAVDYLISLGINANRLIAKGYGESNPAVICNCSNCTEEEHQKNRRTTFKILE
ncbi:MAG: OmpA family protein [Saprospiraceae bacterium]|nr:OmpA family protein [Saprospiraceae bacterium]